MMLLTKEMLRSEMKSYLDGHSPFSAVRRFVFQYFEAEEGFEVTEELDDVFEVFLPYLQHEESVGDPDRELRLRRLHELLGDTPTFLKERAVFAIEFDKLRDLAKKASDGTISNSIYLDQVSKLSPCKFDYEAVASWANSHIDDQKPVLAKIGDGFNA
ncbi:MAG: hypothetical protein GXX96_04115 [Planctomycetaceae bacterium]|jgi:hypothetical protein|nr:hypothetical protein [Planctomycetaceae bacterium]